MNSKDMLVDKVDIFFLLKQQKLITRRELATLLPAQSYNDYRTNYYRKRVPEVFDRNITREWFVYRYLDSFYEQRKKSICSIHKFEKPDICIIAKGIAEDVPGTIMHSISSRCSSIERLWIQQQSCQNRLSRMCYILLKKGSDIYDSIQLMKSVVEGNPNIQFEPFDVSDVEEPVISCTDSDYGTAKSMFSSLCKIFKIDEDEVLKTYIANIQTQGSMAQTSTAEFFCNALKDVFLYCYTCAHQYDDPLEMMMGCRNHKSTEASIRRREFLVEYQGLGDLKIKTKEEELNKMITMVEENHYKCEFCGKGFKEEMFIFNHFNNKHEDEIKKIDKSIEDFRRFLDRVDCFMLEMLDGTDDDRVPRFIQPSIKDERVIYDMDRIFSGEIVLGK
ncbi:hypothetical protein HK407_05g09090 [Ordospora pajunii]|uniref:uncharacterized protein n=1 Tax=Ordospora pajunii TaxID=3039483 RepID=UPI00295263BC|nr:uncharacterized protein HK407_05g09090 [Ordospora pajunii]KAH9411530.1 hypothetical protein HK407_05g09090 [Ordospora pajunii]